METWLIIFISLCFSSLLRYIFSLFSSPTKLPPGPLRVPVIGNLLWLQNPISQLESTLRNLKAKYGPIITLSVGSQVAVLVSDHSLAHRALIQNGAVFADRPPALEVGKMLNIYQLDINTTSYGPTWSLLRRNLTSEMLHPSRVKSYAPARKWVLDNLTKRIESTLDNKSGVEIMHDFQHALFSLVLYMCFGHKVDRKNIMDIQRVQQDLVVKKANLRILDVLPRMGKLFLSKRWKQLHNTKKNQDRLLIPFIRSRREAKLNKKADGFMLAYVDSLHDLELPEEKRKLSEEEIVSLCSEFLSAGAETIAIALQWIIANIVKYLHIQDKLVEEIESVIGKECDKVNEEDLSKMKYLEAVILEGLRRHPPAQYMLPHAVSTDIEFSGHFLPKNTIVNFTIAEMGRDAKVWEDPMEFKPERFLSAGGEMFDITGNKGIKMMPFGAGRRICPGYGFALFHLKYFLSNLVWRFQWTPADGNDVDLSEKQHILVLAVMKNPLNVCISLRKK